MQPLRIDKTVWDHLRDWDYDWSIVTDWIASTYSYHVAAHGPIGQVLFFGVVIALLLIHPLTRMPIKWVFDVVIVQSIRTLVTGFWVVAATSVRWLFSQGFVRIRYALRQIGALVTGRSGGG